MGPVQPTSTQPRRPPRWVLVPLGVVLLAVGAWLVGDRGQPHFQGQPIRAWFRQTYRNSLASWGFGESSAWYEARLAFLEMGTNAVPFLIKEAFTFRPDSPLRTQLHDVFRELPEWAGRGAFTPYSEIQDQAVRLLRALEPPANVLVPLLQPHLESTNETHRVQATILLGSVGEGAGSVVPQLLQTATTSAHRLARAAAWQSLRQIGIEDADVLSALLAIGLLEMDSEVPFHLFLSWIGEFGSQGAPAVPILEPWLGHTNLDRRVRSALAIVQINPSHSNVWQLLTVAAAPDSEGPKEPDSRGALLNAVSRMAPQSNDRLADLIEPLAQREIADWNARNASFRAVNALQRIAPERTKTLCEPQLARSGDIRIHAARILLCLDRDHPAATETLVQAIPDLRPDQLSILGEASSTNRLAIEALEGVVAGKGGPEPQPPSSVVQKRAVESAKAALARIRYREAREARGLKDGDWR